MSVHVSKRFAEDDDEGSALVSEVRARLDEGETLLCVLAVSKIQPSLDFLAVTNSRVVAGWRGDLTNSAKNLPVVIPIEAVNAIEVTGFMDNVKFVLANGDDLKVGNLWDDTDEEPLRSAVRAAQSGEGDPTGPPTYELYEAPDPEER